MNTSINGQASTLFFDAQNAWNSWYLESTQHRSESLQVCCQALVKEHATLVPVMQYHIQHGTDLLSEPHKLVGPTGETNELYAVGRGVTLLVVESTELNDKMAFVAQLTCALIAGNSVIACCDDSQFTSSLDAILSTNLPKKLVQFADFSLYSAFCESDVRSVGTVVEPNTLKTINRQLAARDGAIATLTSESDRENLPVSHDPKLSLRFITERTRTINITAVGGNATLLELGSDSHS